MERGLRCVNGGGGVLVLGWRLKKLLVVMVVLGDIFSLEFAVFLQSFGSGSENCFAAGLRRENFERLVDFVQKSRTALTTKSKIPPY